MSPGWALSGSILLGAQAQVLLRRGVRPAANPAGGFRRYLSPWVAGWLVSFLFATALWLLALAHMQISLAYPMVGAGYVVVALLAAVFLKEEIGWRRWLAISVIIAGLALVARSQ